LFTGIIEEIGVIKVIKKGTKSATLTVEGKVIFSDLKIGDSVATNGVCLTVTSFDKNRFTAEVMNETLMRSALGEIKTGNKVNLERAMLANGRFGGHIVSGHIDGIGKINLIRTDDIATWYDIKTSPNIMKYIIEKGSICIDGISLTVAKVKKDSFSVSVIPHTAKETTLMYKRIGAIVNLENDIFGKYIEKFVTLPKEKEILFQNEY